MIRSMAGVKDLGAASYSMGKSSNHKEKICFNINPIPSRSFKTSSFLSS